MSMICPDVVLLHHCPRIGINLVRMSNLTTAHYECVWHNSEAYSKVVNGYHICLYLLLCTYILGFDYCRRAYRDLCFYTFMSLCLFWRSVSLAIITHLNIFIGAMTKINVFLFVYDDIIILVPEVWIQKNSWIHLFLKDSICMMYNLDTFQGSLVSTSIYSDHLLSCNDYSALFIMKWFFVNTF